MDQADFVHMVRMSEIASAENSSAYRRSVAAFAALGYAWVLGCLVLALGMVAWAVPPLLAGRFKLVFVMVLISGLTLLGLLFTSNRLVAAALMVIIGMGAGTLTPVAWGSCRRSRRRRYWGGYWRFTISGR